MAYAALSTIQVTNPGSILTAAWCTQAGDNDAFLANSPVCSIYGAAQSLANDTTTSLTAGFERFDNDAMHSTAVNTSRITAQTAGRYLFVGSVSYVANTTGRRLIYISINGGTVVDTSLFLLYSAAAPVSPTTAVGAVVFDWPMIAGDYVELRGNQNSGGSLNATMRLSAYWLSL